MFREAHSHGAYQDFVWEVGAPNILLTDNSQTQSSTFKQRNSWQVQNDTYSRERDAASVRHCLAHDSDQRKKEQERNIH